MAKPKQEVAVQQPAEPSGKALMALGDYAIAKHDAKAIAEIIRANIGDGPINDFTFDRIKVPTSGGQIWQVPTLEGVSDAREIEGVIVAWKETRGFWKESFDVSGGGTPPDCASSDSIVGRGTPGGECLKCPLALFGSADQKTDSKGNKIESRSQACKQVRLLFLLQKDTMLPVIVACPPTSLTGARKFFLRLASNGVPYYGVVTRLMLTPDKNKDGIKYSKVEMSVVGKLSDEARAKMRDYGAAFQPTVEHVVVAQSDVRE